MAFGKPTLNVTDFVIIAVVAMAALAVHQKLVAPRLK